MRKYIFAFILIFIIAAITGCGVSEATKQQMRERAARRSERNLGVLIEQAKKDLSQLASDTAKTIKDGYDEYAPIVKEKTEDIIENARENGPDIVRDYVDHQKEFWGDTIDYLSGNSEKEAPTPTPIMPEGVTLEGPFKIGWVSDGDTFAVYTDPAAIHDKDNKDENGQEYAFRYIRLIGCDAPESVAPTEYLELHPEKSNGEPGKTASGFSKELLKKTGMVCWLEKDVQDTDPYDRLLRYVYINMDGQLIMMNRYLLEEGMTKLMTVPPNVARVEELTAAQKKAFEEKKGFWADGLFTEE